MRGRCVASFLRGSEHGRPEHKAGEGADAAEDRHARGMEKFLKLLKSTTADLEAMRLGLSDEALKREATEAARGSRRLKKGEAPESTRAAPRAAAAGQGGS